jgi:hypothetical protein
MGNELRTDDFTICWTDKRDLGTDPEIPSMKSPKQVGIVFIFYIFQGDILLAIGFQVYNIETFTTRHHKSNEKSTISPAEDTPEKNRVRVAGVGQYQKYFDGINKINIEIFCPGSGKDQTTEAEKSKAHAAKELTKPAELTREDVVKMTKDPLPGIFQRCFTLLIISDILLLEPYRSN